MAIKVGIFHENTDIVDNFCGKLELSGFKPFLVNNLDNWEKFTQFEQLDAAIIHTDYLLRGELATITARTVIARLPQSCCRILTSGHKIETYIKETLALKGDYYVQRLLRNEELIALLSWGGVDSEQINLRGFLIKREKGVVHKAEMGLASDRDGDDEERYIAKAKRGERE